MASARSDLDGMVDECLCTHMAVLDGKLYAVGGFNGDHLSSVERYDSADRECVGGGGGAADGDGATATARSDSIAVLVYSAPR